MIEFVPYTLDQQPVWADAFVADAKNGAFLFQRADQDYHADRLPDYSFLLRRDGEPIGLLPASVTKWFRTAVSCSAARCPMRTWPRR